MFAAEAADTAPCGTAAPRALGRQLDRARALFVHAGAVSPARASGFIRRALVALDRADAVRYRSMRHGAIGADCSAALTRFVRRAQGGAVRWQTSLRPGR